MKGYNCHLISQSRSVLPMPFHRSKALPIKAQKAKVRVTINEPKPTEVWMPKAPTGPHICSWLPVTWCHWCWPLPTQTLCPAACPICPSLSWCHAASITPHTQTHTPFLMLLWPAACLLLPHLTSLSIHLHSIAFSHRIQSWHLTLPPACFHGCPKSCISVPHCQPPDRQSLAGLQDRWLLQSFLPQLFIPVTTSYKHGPACAPSHLLPIATPIFNPSIGIIPCHLTL